MADIDIGAELHDKIKAAFTQRCGKDSTITHIKRKIENGTATMEDTSVYARRLGENLRKAIEGTTKPGDLPGEKMYYNIAQSILEPMLRDNYEDVNGICADVQQALDAKKGIGLKPQKASFPEERVRAAVNGAVVKETAEHAIQVLGRTAENITGSFQTDYIKKNAEFRSKAGLDCYIERKDGHNCCKWCAALAGKYSYPDDVPKDVYRRHDNCTCDVSYISEKGRQNVHTKKWTKEPRKIEYEKPTKLTREEAQAKQSEILAQRRLTYDAKRGIIELASNTHSRNRELEETIKRCINQEKPVFADDLAKFFNNIPSEKGKYIMALHGSTGSAFIYGYEIDARTLANIVKSRKDYNGKDDIVLISCNTGSEDVKKCFAQKFADAMGVRIHAPTHYGAITPWGTYYSSDLRGKKLGKFIPFEPKKEMRTHDRLN